MPNHVTNILEFDCSPEQFQKTAQFLKADNSFLGSIDFNKLIPMPASLNIEAGSRGEKGLKLYKEYMNDCKGISDERKLERILQQYQEKTKDDPEVFDLGKQYYDNLQKYGAKTWYEWNINNWGTKWNAYDYKPLTPGEQTLTFCTAWSAVPKIADLISKRLPDSDIKYSWADENIGHNLGSVTLRNGELIDMHIPDPGSKEAVEMAASIMDADPADWGLHFSAESNTYEYREEEPVPNDNPSPAKHKEESR